MPGTLSRTIATFFGAGFFPKAPGTFATLAALPLYLLMRRLSTPVYLLVLAKLVLLGVIASDRAEREWGKDPSRVVIDEVCGLLVSLIARPGGIREIALGTALFRFFDIVKPFPVGTIDRKMNGGLGIMADDIAAGALSALVLEAVRRRGWLS
jgi:phosphatidylglycerophosphatase A